MLQILRWVWSRLNEHSHWLVLAAPDLPISNSWKGSWFIWTMLGFIAFFSQLAKGATNSLWLTVGQTTSVLIIFLLSLKYGYGGLGKRDLRALIGAGIGLVLWYLTRE